MMNGMKESQLLCADNLDFQMEVYMKGCEHKMSCDLLYNIICNRHQRICGWCG